MADEDHVAYGEYPRGAENEESDRGLVTDAFQNLQRNEGVASFFNKLQGAAHNVKFEFDRLTGQDLDQSQHEHGRHRFDSFVGPQDGNDVKWYVDGAGYFYAVSIALREARESIWILDCRVSLQKA